MFKHKGAGRTYSHNLKLASILSGVAGIVNITGVLAVGKLTTNVTGHFAFFSEELFLKNYWVASIYLLYTLFFLFGAFLSSLVMEADAKFRPHTSYVIPILIEVIILSLVAFSGPFLSSNAGPYPLLLPGALLFSMGLQNALVTRVSRSVVRTTHLTGLFTDLGIELSQLLFYRKRSQRTKLNKSIFLKLMIISCFFLGGIIGGLTYQRFALHTLFLPVGLLLFALWYDRLLSRYHSFRRRLSGRR